LLIFLDNQAIKAIIITSEEDTMCKRLSVTWVAICLLLAAFHFLLPLNVAAQNVPRGSVIGFLYAKDGTTPLEGAVVQFKNLTSGLVFESSKTDQYGIFKVQEGLKRASIPMASSLPRAILMPRIWSD
jgi:hypothetical protein